MHQTQLQKMQNMRMHRVCMNHLEAMSCMEGHLRCCHGEDGEVVKCYHEANNGEHYEDTSRSCDRIHRPAILNWCSVRDHGEAFQFSIPSVVISPTCGISWRNRGMWFNDGTHITQGGQVNRLREKQCRWYTLYTLLFNNFFWKGYKWSFNQLSS